VDGISWHANNLRRLLNNWINFTIDSDTPVATSPAGLVWKPVIPVPPPQDLDNSDSELFQLRITTSVPSANQVNQKVGRRL